MDEPPHGCLCCARCSISHKFYGAVNIFLEDVPFFSYTHATAFAIMRSKISINCVSWIRHAGLFIEKRAPVINRAGAKINENVARALG